MQMPKMYASLDRKARAAEMRRDSIECGRKGFPVIAEVLREEADLLDPPARDERFPVRREAQQQRRA